ncbi:unnamed protein product, partial [Prorocentrum cordatum]
PGAIIYKGGPQTIDEPDAIRYDRVSATMWESSQIPSSIRKPWDIFEGHPEEALNGLSDTTDEEEQHAFEEVSIVELAAHVHYRRHYTQGRGADGEQLAAKV